jgi:dephospho-CoA kinase
MLRVALTGGIATGKSYALERLSRLGVPCLDADSLAHGVMAPGTEATRAIAARFGEAMIDAQGAVDRRRLAPIVFADAQARQDLEALVHPAVRRAITAGLKGFELTGSALAVVGIPLLYETGREGDFDKVVATVCSRSKQLSRLEARGLSPNEAELRVTAQVPADEKAGRADLVIDTNGSFEATDAQIEEVFRRLQLMASRVAITK